MKNFRREGGERGEGGGNQMCDLANLLSFAKKNFRKEGVNVIW